MDSRQAPGLGVKLSLAVAGFAGLMDTAFLLGVIAAYAKYLGADEDLAGFIAGLYSMVAIPASVLAGFIVDRIGRRRSLLAGLAWDAASMTAYSYTSTPTELALVRGLHALGGSLVYPALFAMIGDIAGRGRRGSYSGSYLAVVGLAVAVGSALGGRVTEAYGFTAAFRLVALILLAGLLAALVLPETARPRRVGAEAGSALLERPAAGVGRYILAAAVVIAVLYAGFGLIVGGLANALLAVGLAATEEEAAGLTGMTIGFMTAASLPFFILAGRAADRGLGAPVLIASSLAAATGSAILAGAGGHGELALFSLLWAPFLGVSMTMSTYLAVSVPSTYRGRSVAIQQVSNILGVAVGAPAGGVLADKAALTGVSAGLAFTAILMILVALYVRPLLSKASLSQSA